MLTIYLAGAIRDGRPDDIAWREDVITCVWPEHKGALRWLNPLGGKQYSARDKTWTMSGIPSTARSIVAHDFWAVDHSDVVIYNFTALSERYPNIGTLVEFGRATRNGCLIYTILDPAYTGHQNQTMYKLHPFLDVNSAATFPSVVQAIRFLDGHLRVLAGAQPRFGGVTV